MLVRLPVPGVKLSSQFVQGPHALRSQPGQAGLSTFKIPCPCLDTRQTQTDDSVENTKTLTTRKQPKTAVGMTILSMAGEKKEEPRHWQASWTGSWRGGGGGGEEGMRRGWEGVGQGSSGTAGHEVAASVALVYFQLLEPSSGCRCGRREVGRRWGGVGGWGGRGCGGDGRGGRG